MSVLVVLHGWGQSRNEWESVSKQFSADQVEIFDLPGFGTEPLVSESWGVPEYAAWVEKRIQNAHYSDVILLGHSFGGRIAALIASRRPSWLTKLVLYGAPVIYRPSASVQARIAIAKIVKPLLPTRSSGNSELDMADKKGLGAIFRRVVPFDLTAELPSIAAPTLLLWGENDTAVPLAIARESKELIKGSELKILPGAGHNAHLENPTLFVGMVNRFIQT